MNEISPKKRAKLSPAESTTMNPETTKELGENYSTAGSDDNVTIFTLAGFTADVCLLVFEQEYHVHSVILKLYSTYFRKSLDSPDKPGKPASVKFHYEYATTLDDDGSWALEPANNIQDPVFTPERLGLFEKGGKLSPKVESDTFGNLLCAMYNDSYTIHKISDIVKLTRLADFYCALPIVSATLSGQFWESVLFIEIENEHAVSSDPVTLIFAARKLRHRHLYLECLVHIVSQLSHIESQQGAALEKLQQDDDLHSLVQRLHKLVFEKIMKVSLKQIKFMQQSN